MTVYHDEVEIEDFEYDEDEDLYTYPCVSLPWLSRILSNVVGNRIESRNCLMIDSTVDIQV